jgi:GNAT superfamily N-acetyltransferase
MQQETLSEGYVIRRAEPAQLTALAAIERAAAELFLTHPIHIAPELLDDTLAPATLHRSLARGRLWLALHGDNPVGFACVLRYGRLAHLRELAVHPEHGRRGLGSALVRAVCNQARRQRLAGVTLTTFRDIPWNAPLYARLGFRELAPENCPVFLRHYLAAERRRGLTYRLTMGWYPREPNRSVTPSIALR